MENIEKVLKMSHDEFVQFMSNCMTDVSAITVQDVTYIEYMNEINDMLSGAKPFSDTPQNRLNILDRLKYIAEMSPTKPKENP